MNRVLSYILHFIGEPPFEQIEIEGGIPILLRIPIVILIWMLVVFSLIMGWFMTVTPEAIPLVIFLILMIIIRLSFVIIKCG